MATKAQLKSLYDDIGALLKISESKAKKPVKTSDCESGTCKKPTKIKKIDNAKKKSELSLFSVKELKTWLMKNGVSTKKIDKSLKKDCIDLVWEYLSADSESESSDSDSDSESDSDSDSGSDSD